MHMHEYTVYVRVYSYMYVMYVCVFLTFARFRNISQIQIGFSKQIDLRRMKFGISKFIFSHHLWAQFSHAEKKISMKYFFYKNRIVIKNLQIRKESQELFGRTLSKMCARIMPHGQQIQQIIQSGNFLLVLIKYFKNFIEIIQVEYLISQLSNYSKFMSHQNRILV